MSLLKQLIPVGTGEVAGMLCLPDGSVLVAGGCNACIRMLSAESHDGSMQVSTVAGNSKYGHWDGDAAQARFDHPHGLALLSDGRVLVTDRNAGCIRMLSAESHAGGMQVSTVAGFGEEGHRDGTAAQAQFHSPCGLAVLPDDRVLVADECNSSIRMLSADLQQVSTVAGDGECGHRDGAAVQAQFCAPHSLALLSDGRVLVADCNNHCIRMLSHAGGMQVSTVAGNGEQGHRDGAAAQAQFSYPQNLALLPDGRVLLTEFDSQYLRMLSADLQQVSTLTIEDLDPGSAVELLPDGRVLVAAGLSIHVLKGFPSAKWVRRRWLLLGLRAAARQPDARPLCVLQRLAQLPAELWPSLFQYV